MSPPPNATTDDGTKAVELTESDRHELLAAERRRLTLDILEGKTASIELASLATGIAARERGLDAADEDVVKRVTVSLHHTHLPIMVDAGVLDYDPEAKRIDPSGRTVGGSRPNRTARR